MRNQARLERTPRLSVKKEIKVQIPLTFFSTVTKVSKLINRTTNPNVRGRHEDKKIYIVRTEQTRDMECVG